MNFLNQIFNSFLSNLLIYKLYRYVFIPRNIFTGAINFLSGQPTNFPLTINFLITLKCNYVCRMCVSTLKRSNDCVPIQSMDLLTIKNFIGSIRKFQSVVHFSGGEPFMCKDFNDILACIKQNGLKCMLTTNGSLLHGDSLISALKYVDILIVSLYGTREIHDQVVGITGAFDRTIENLKRLIKNKRTGMRIMVSCIPLPENIASLPSLFVDLRLIGVDSIKIEQFNFMTPAEYARSIPFIVNGLDLKPEIFLLEKNLPEGFINKVLHLRRLLQYADLPVYMKPHLTDEQMRDWYSDNPLRKNHCRFISHSVFINHNGDILPCQFLTCCVFGNIRKDSLEVIWHSKSYQQFRKMIKEEPLKVCGRCCKS